MEAAEAQGRNEAASAAAAEVRREKEEIKKKGSESFKKTGLGDSWKESVEDIFRMFSKSPESKGASKRKRASSPDDTAVSATTSAASSSSSPSSPSPSSPSSSPSSSPAAVKKARTDSGEEK
jgi:hypothetical protein